MGNSVCGGTKDVRHDDEKAHKRQSSHTGILSGMALKFPYVRKAFKNVKAVFDKNADPSSKTIRLDGIRPALEELGGRGLSDEDVKALFKAADLKGTKLIEFREFLICVALGIYLKQDMEIEKAKAQFGEKYAQNLKGFRVVLDAFRKIDKDGGGSLDPKELKEALFEVNADSEETKEILDARFKELDFDGNKDIEYPEFVYGFSAWVGLAEDDDDEDDTLTASNTTNNIVAQDS